MTGRTLEFHSLSNSYSIVKVPKFFPKVTDLNFDQNLNIFETATGESVFNSGWEGGTELALYPKGGHAYCDDMICLLSW